MGHGQPGFPSIEIDSFAQQQSGHHPAEENQMALIADETVLTREADQLSMNVDRGCHGDLDWFRSPTLSWLPAHPIS